MLEEGMEWTTLKVVESGHPCRKSTGAQEFKYGKVQTATCWIHLLFPGHEQGVGFPVICLTVH